MTRVFDQDRIDVMTWLRFPLIMGVVFLHSNLFVQVTRWTGCEPLWPDWLIYMFNNLTDIVLPPLVPLLFIISGYFFFRTNQKREKTFFIDKYKRRIHSLLIPYIAWNTIAIISLYLRFNIFNGENYTLFDYLSGYWNFTQRDMDAPANMPLWYMRDLMVVSLFAPVINWLLKKKISGLVFIVILLMCNIYELDIPIAGFNLESFMFFSIGAYIAIHNVDIANISSKMEFRLFFFMCHCRC